MLLRFPSVIIGLFTALSTLELIRNLLISSDLPIVVLGGDDEQDAIVGSIG